MIMDITLILVELNCTYVVYLEKNLYSSKKTVLTTLSNRAVSVMSVADDLYKGAFCPVVTSQLPWKSYVITLMKSKYLNWGNMR